MVIFLISAVPLLGLIYLFNFYGRSLENREVLQPGAAGIIVMTAVMLVMYIFNGTVHFSYTRSGIFLREWITGFAFPYVLLTAALGLLRGRILLREQRETRYGELCAFWFGAGTMMAVFHALYTFGSYNAYDLFLYPVLLFLFCCGSAYLTAFFLAEEGAGRYVYALAGLLPAALAALVPYVYYLNHRLSAYLIFAAVLLIGGIYLYLLDIKKLLPRP